MNNRRDWLTISDIHIGAKKTKAEEILEHLTRFFDDFKVVNNFDDLKVIFIAGDLWDKSVHFSSPDIAAFFRFWHRFCHWAIRKNIEVIVMEGTPEHDALQGKNLQELTQIGTPELKFRYIRDLCVQYVEPLDMQVLFIPDECRENAEMIYQAAQNAVEQAGLLQADMAIMHGMFTYQLGSIPLNSKVHREGDYLRLVKGFINIGHIHTASSFERIYAQGSFDRLAHGEEEPKGAYYFSEVKPNEWVPVFLENKYAKQYRTFLVSDELDDKQVQKFKKMFKGIPDGSYIRLLVKQNSSLKENKTLLSTLFPQYIFSVEDAKIAKNRKKVVAIDVVYEQLSLNPQTLVQLILEEVKTRTGLTVETSELLANELKDIINVLEKSS